MRLDKFLCDMGLGTRSEIKNGIRKGMALVDGKVCKRPETQVSEEQQVSYQGKPVSYTAFEYYMLHKPAGVVSATEDSRDRTVLDLIQEKKRKDLFPVGRLDKDTEGLLLITNDGPLAHRLLSPKKHVDKVYEALVKGQVTEEHAERFQQGIDIGDERLTLPAKLTILPEDLSRAPAEVLHALEEIQKGTSVTRIRLTLREGRFHQVKRMMEAMGCPVVYLKRLSMGPLLLDPKLKPGEYRPLTQEELQWLKEL